MRDIEGHGMIPVLNLQSDNDGERYLQVMAWVEFNDGRGCYSHLDTRAIFTRGDRRKVVSSKKALVAFADKYGFSPRYITVNGIEP